MEFKLIIKKLNNTLSKEEAIEFSNWYHSASKHKTYFNQVKANFENGITPVDLEKGWNSIEKQIDPKQTKPYWKYVIAASLVLALVSALFFQMNRTTTTIERTLVEHQIESGTDKATLTLEDGSNVALAKGGILNLEHAKSNGEQLSYKQTTSSTLPEIAYNYLTVPRGGQFFVKLSDGTQIWLNADSQLKYPINFETGKTRQVELVYGEAYFDVSPSTVHNGDAFIVKSNGQTIEVLGTEFNVNTYKNDGHIYTTLVEGKVEVRRGNIQKQLVPGEQAALDLKNNNIEIKPTDIQAAMGWKNGVFVFNDTPLEQIMETLSRWYDMDVAFEDSSKKQLEFSGILSRSKDINDLLDNFKKTNEVNFKYSHKSIAVQ